MGRAPCCDEMGLKRGPWTPHEDDALITYINHHGHSNWRALPKRAGLLRCGKSCRLRWMNYLRPDIKRGNFSKTEEETIIKLHEELGNKWSVIAARLPGRTDNEIKNVWHTHLKKRLIGGQHRPVPATETVSEIRLPDPLVGSYCARESTSPAHSSSDGSSVSAAVEASEDGVYAGTGLLHGWPQDFPWIVWNDFSDGTDSLVESGSDANDFMYGLFGSHGSVEFLELPEFW